MSVTLKQIAERANVSISTVSRVINHDPRKSASPETVALIWNLVQEMGYIPNQSARNLTQKQSLGRYDTQCSIGFVLADEERDLFRDSYFSEIHYGASSAAMDLGVSVKFACSNANKNYHYIDYSSVDGIILLGRFSLESIEHIRSKTPNVVYAGMGYFNLGFDEVLCEAALCTNFCINYLADRGHRQIAYLGHIDTLETILFNEHRFEQYKNVLQERSIPFDPDIVCSTAALAEAGYHSMKTVLKNKIPSAVFCTGDMIALGAVKAIAETSLKIPEDISVISIGNTGLCSCILPGITSLDIPLTEIGKVAFKTLYDRIKGGHTIPQQIHLPFSLVERESCAIKI